MAMITRESTAIPLGREREAPAAIGAIPTQVVEIDASLPIVDARLGARSGRALLLIYWRGEPVGEFWLNADGDLISAERLREIVQLVAGENIEAHALAEWLRTASHQDGANLSLTVAVCSRNASDELSRSLKRVCENANDVQEVIVVDYGTRPGPASEVVSRWPAVRYVRAENSSLVEARNLALREARGDIVAFQDSEVGNDAGWVRAVRREFADSRTLCVSGPAFPTTVTTRAQDWSVSSTAVAHRFERVVYDGAISKPFTTPSAQIRSKMALRRSVLHLVGAFDEALEVRAGSLAGVDHDMMARILVAGYRVVYQPMALFDPPRHWQELQHQTRSAAAGIGAYLTRHVFRGELGALTVAAAWLGTRLFGLAATALSRGSRDRASILRAEVGGFIAGAAAYTRRRGLTNRPKREPIPALPDVQTPLDAVTATSGQQARISVIIPTHNRRESLLRLLTTLRDGTRRPDEIIVVADGCTDDSVTSVRQTPFPFPLTVLEQSPARGAAAARNLGAAHASGDVLLFIDDDIEALPTLVAVHAEHGLTSNRVVVGAPIPVRSGDSLHDREMWSWWEREFERLRTPGYRFTHNDVFSGVLSVPAPMFRAVGGFDTAFESCRDDSELALRVFREGARVIFSRAGGGLHHELRNPARLAGRKRAEGRADVLIAARHNEIGPSLRIAWQRRPWWTPMGLLRRAAFSAPTLGRSVAALATALMRIAERARARRIWRVLNAARAYYWYWDGVAAFVGSEAAVRNLVSAAARWSPNELIVDLSSGMEAVAREVDRVRPDTVLVTFADREIGRVPAPPGVERLHAEHLRHILAQQFAGALVRELKAAGEIRLPWDAPAMPPLPSSVLRSDSASRRALRDPA